MSLTPIETRYKGFRFRSRLEARWAVFFDTLCLRWEYEPEGFELPGGIRYLPDFRVFTPQGAPCWYEVKASHIEEDKKFSAFKASLNADWERYWSNLRSRDFDIDSPTKVNDPPMPLYFRACLLRGDPYEYIGMVQEPAVCPRCGFLGGDYSAVDVYSDYVSVGCYPCDWETPCGVSPEEKGVSFLRATPWKGNVHLARYQYNDFLREIRYAANTARGFRFDRREPVL